MNKLSNCKWAISFENDSHDVDVQWDIITWDLNSFLWSTSLFPNSYETEVLFIWTWVESNLIHVQQIAFVSQLFQIHWIVWLETLLRELDLKIVSVNGFSYRIQFQLLHSKKEAFQNLKFIGLISLSWELFCRKELIIYKNAREKFLQMITRERF